MIKFRSDDFDYTKRIGCIEPFGYLFNVRGKSANYLINKYQLDYPIVFVNCYMDKTIYIGSRQYSNKNSDCYGCDEDDVEELYNILRPIIDIVLRNHEDCRRDEMDNEELIKRFKGVLTGSASEEDITNFTQVLIRIAKEGYGERKPDPIYEALETLDDFLEELDEFYGLCALKYGREAYEAMKTLHSWYNKQSNKDEVIEYSIDTLKDKVSFNEYEKLTEKQALEKLNHQESITKKEAKDILFSLCDAVKDRAEELSKQVLSEWDYYRGEFHGMDIAIKLISKLK